MEMKWNFESIPILLLVFNFIYFVFYSHLKSLFQYLRAQLYSMIYNYHPIIYPVYECFGNYVRLLHLLLASILLFLSSFLLISHISFLPYLVLIFFLKSYSTDSLINVMKWCTAVGFFFLILW